MATVTYEWVPEPIVIAEELDMLALRFEDRRVVMHEALQVVLANTEEHFAEEGPGWAPWAPATEMDSRRGESILTRSDALRSAATSEGSYQLTSEYILWTGANAPAYWRFHWTGTSKMPERNFIGLDSKGEDEVVAVFDAWMGTLGW